LVLAIGGIQLFCLSILGDYLGKVLEEAKSRPRYIRARVYKGADAFGTQHAIEEMLDMNRRTVAERTNGKYR
jgi:hypothetical protein